MNEKLPLRSFINEYGRLWEAYAFYRLSETAQDLRAPWCSFTLMGSSNRNFVKYNTKMQQI